MAYAFVFVIGLLGVVVYLTLMYSAIPGAVDERLGRLEPLPQHLGEWVQDTDSDAAEAAQSEGLAREIRYLHHPRAGLLGREFIAMQTRYRDLATGKITRVEAEQKVVRKRVHV